jgi:protein-S-isoprenylcysteine O-methyltransferase Ste14
MIAVFLVFAFMIAFLVMQRVLRRDGSSGRSPRQQSDRGTRWLIGAAFGVSWLALFLSIPAAHYRLGLIHPSFVFASAGFALMCAGFFLRAIAARTLGRFYTGTLRVAEAQVVVCKGLYRTIRHPGYLGTMLFFIASGLAVSNYLALLAIAASIIPAYLRRITVEEQMLLRTMGEAYETYMKKTKRLLPFIF